MTTVANPTTCSHDRLVLIPDLDAYECYNPTCRRLFERVERQFCSRCRTPLSAWARLGRWGDGLCGAEPCLTARRRS